MPRSSRIRLVAATAASSILVAGCATGSATSPGDAMENRFAQGTTIAVTLAADPSALTDPDEAEALQQALDAQAGGALMTLGVDPDGAVTSWSLLDAFHVRRAGDDLYLRVDWATVEKLQDEPMAEDPRTAIEQLGASMEDNTELFTALANGDWIGITGISDSAEQLLGGMMGPSEAPLLPDTSNEEVTALLAEQNLDSVANFMATYVTAEGDGPWELTIDGVALQQALEEIEEAAEEAGVPSDQTEVLTQQQGDLPATITGLTLTADDDMATELRIDIDEFASSMSVGMADEELAELAEMTAADPEIVLTMTDLGDNTGAPADATTIPMADLVALMGQQGG